MRSLTWISKHGGVILKHICLLLKQWKASKRSAHGRSQQLSFVFVPLAIQNANIQDVSFTAPPSLLLGQTAQSWLLFIPYSSPPPAPPKALCADWFCAFWHWFGVLVMGLWWKYGLIQVSDVKGVVDTWKCGLVVGSFFCRWGGDVDLFLGVGLSISVFVWYCASIWMEFCDYDAVFVGKRNQDRGSLRSVRQWKVSKYDICFKGD